MSRFGALILGLCLAVLSEGPASAAITYDWTFTVQALSDGFQGPPDYLGQTLGSGTLTTSSSHVSDLYDDGFGDTYAAETYAVTDIQGTLAGARITGLAPNGAPMDVVTTDGAFSFVADNRLQVLATPYGADHVVSPAGVLVVNLASAVDAGTLTTYAGAVLATPGRQLSLQADPVFGSFVDTQRGNEWQGALTLTPVSGVAEPTAWAELIVGAGRSASPENLGELDVSASFRRLGIEEIATNHESSLELDLTTGRNGAGG